MLTAQESKAEAAASNGDVRRAEALLKTGALQSAIFNSAHFSSIATDVKGVIQIFNVGAERMLGYTAAEVVDKITPAALSDPHELIVRAEALSLEFETPITPGFEALVFKAARGIEDIYELTYIRKDGTRLPAVVSVTALRDAQKAIIGYLLIGTDNTARQRVEEERLKLDRDQAELDLRRERDRAQRYLDTAEVILLALDVEGRVTLANRYACAVFGWTSDELVGRDFIETCVPARLREETRQKLGNVLAGPDSSIVDNAIVTRSGEERMVEWRNTLLRNADGHVVSTLSSGTDITDRNQAGEALRTAEARTQFALQSANVGIWDMDYGTGVLRWSELLQDQHGLEPGTFGGRFEDFVRCVHPDDRDSLNQTVGDAMRSGADFSIQYRTLWPDGTVRALSGAGRIHLDEFGKPARGLGVTLDVTERLALEQQFQQAQKMEAIGRLAGGVAHDFNNLLTVILGNCELLLADHDPRDPRQADIREIQKAGASAARLTRQLLAFSRKQIIEPKLLDLNAVVLGIRPMLDRLIGEDISVVLGLAAQPVLLTADRGQVEQIVLNLSVNARDAMPKGGTLTIETAGVEVNHRDANSNSMKPGPYVTLTVRDTGTGMTPEVRTRLFEPFFTTKEVGKGTGLGLASVHGIVASSGGSVIVVSELGKGASFRVYFPRSDSGATVVEPPPPAARPHATETILVVEDEAGLRELARRLLQRQGFTVLLAANAEEALRIFEGTDSVDVLLTDVVMPGTSGPELVRQLMERRPALKVIYMSGYNEEAIVHHGVLVPGIAFLHKPFTAESLELKISEVLAVVT